MAKALARGGLSLRDNKILEAAANGWSADQIAEKYDVTPEFALVRIKQILASEDVWDTVEREKLLLRSIYMLKENLESDYTGIVSDPKQADAYRKTLELLSSTLDRRAKSNRDDLDRVTAAQAKKIIDVVQAAWLHARQLLRDEYPDVDLALIDARFQQGLEIEAAKDE